MNKRQKKKWERWFIKDFYKWLRRHRQKVKEVQELFEKLKEQEYDD